MRKTISFLVALTLLVVPVLGMKPNGKSAYNGLEHPGKASQLYLYEKDTSWNPVNGGAWGKLMFKDKFVFNGHKLQTGTDYTLIRYTDPWAGSPVCLGSGISDGKGNVHISGAMQSGGSKVWLVLTSDVNCGTAMTGWNPTAYLFEYNLI